MARGRFLGGLFETKAAGDSVARAAGPALATAGMPLGASAGAWDLEQAVSRGLERVAMVFRCVDAIAQTQARIPMVVAKRGGPREEATPIDDDDLDKLLNFRANSYETSSQFRYRLSAVLLLSQRGAFVEMEKKNGKVVGLHLLAPGRVQPVPHKDKFVSEYRIMRGDSVEDVLQPEQVCWIKSKPHPIDPYKQLTPLVAAGIAAETDLMARMFNRNFLQNDGRPGMLVTIKGKLGRDDAEEIKTRFSGGYAQAGRTSVVEADGVEVADMALNPRDMQWQEMITGSKQDIQLAFGVPESVMGNASGRTFDNADAERENFYVDTVQTHCEPIAMGLDPITGEIDDDNIVAYDYSGIDVLQRMAARKREEWRAEVGMGLRTIDEYRDPAGLVPFNVVGTRILFHTSGLAFGKDPEDQAGIMKYTPVGQPPAAGLTGAAAAESGALKGIEKGLKEGDRQRGNTQAATALRQRALSMVKSIEALETKAKPKAIGHPLAKTTTVKPNQLPHQSAGSSVLEQQHPYQVLRYKMEGMIEGQLIQWDQRQERVVSDRLNHVSFRRYTRHWEYEPEEEIKSGFPAKQKCKYCKEQATKRIIWAEGRAYVPVCDSHLAKAKAKIGGENEVDKVLDVKDCIEVERKALNPTYAVDAEQWTKDLVSGMGNVIRDAMIREAKNTMRNIQADGIDSIAPIELKGSDPLKNLLGDDGIADLLDPTFGEVIDIITKAAENQSQRLQDTINDMDKAGASLKDIERKVRTMIGTRAPWRKNLSINVTTTAVEAARSAVHEMLPSGLYDKTWIAEKDTKTRPTHVKADGQKKAAHQPFRVGGFKMMYPCDPNAPIQERANCRCYQQFSLSEKAITRLESI